jgi:cation diffusion facilitator family transporter
MIKNQYKDTREKDLILQRRVLRLSLVIDLIPVIPVITIALLSKSLLLLSDVYDYIYIILSDVMALIIVNNIIKGKASSYDYGSGKLESLSALITSFMVVIGLIAGAIYALKRFIYPEHLVAEFVLVGFCFHVIGLFINGAMWRRILKIARSTDSPLMEAQWRLYRTNALGNIAVIISLSIALLLRNSRLGVYIDPFCALIYIFIAGIAFLKLIRNILNDLSDRTLNEDLQMGILKRLTEYFNLYDSFHGVRSRRVGKKQFIEISLGFEPRRNFGDFFNLAERIKEAIEFDIPGSDVCVIPVAFEEYDESAIFHRVSKNIDIIPISDKAIEKVMILCKKIFIRDDLELIKMVLEESCNIGTHSAKLKDLCIYLPRFWVAVREGNFLGFSGIYFDPNDLDSVWVGWTAVDPSAGMPAMRAVSLLLRKIASECRKTGRKYIKLLTGMTPGEARAKQLYKNYGFKIFKTEIDEFKDKVLYLEAETESVYKALHSVKIKNNIKHTQT